MQGRQQDPEFVAVGMQGEAQYLCLIGQRLFQKVSGEKDYPE